MTQACAFGRKLLQECMPDSSQEQTWRASWVWAHKGRLLPGAAVVVRQGRIVEIIERPGPGLKAQDLGDGLLLPGLINAHTHLELSGLAGLARPQGDFVDWLLELVATRPQQDPDQAAQATRGAVGQAAASGTVLVGDITNTGRAQEALAQAGMSVVHFFEALGPVMAEPPEPWLRWQDGRMEQSAIAAHSPYSVPGWRITALKRRAGQAPFAVHVAESLAEVEFVAGAGSEGERLRDFLTARGVAREELGIRAQRPLAHLLALGVVDAHTLLVHGVQLNDQEVAQVAASGASLCICPRSNLGLTGSLAPVADLLSAGVNLALGTDSLASTDDLSLWGEMSALAAARPSVDPEDIFTMATAGGARALGVGDQFGELRPGAVGRLAFVPLEATSAKDVLAAALEPDAATRGRAVA